MDNENFTNVYNYVSQQAEGATIAAAAAATLLTEEEVASFFAEPAAFTFEGGVAFANPEYVVPSEPVRVAVDSLAELFPELPEVLPETDELADFLTQYALGDAALADLEYATRGAANELQELATKYGVDATNEGFVLVNTKLRLAAAVLHNLRVIKGGEEG